MSATFIVADDHPLFREALIHAIRNSVTDASIVEADSLESLQTALGQHPGADLLLLDLNMPGVSGFSALAYVRSHYDTLPTIIVSASDDSRVVRRAMQHGASGFISKSSPIATIEDGIRSVMNGELAVPKNADLDSSDVDPEEQAAAAAVRTLTPHQFRVLMMLSEGLLIRNLLIE